MQAAPSTPFYDGIPAWLVMAGTAVVLLLTVEAGFRLGRRRRPETAAAERSSTGVQLGALLTLVGLLLAFSYSMVETRFLGRKELVVEDANAIGTAYLRAGLVPSPHAERIRDLLRQYVEVRTPSGGPREVRDAVQRSQVLHQELWAEATMLAERHPQSRLVGLFVQSLNQLIDVHEERVTLAVYSRLPPPILGTLYAVALLGMGVLGYSAGLAGSRSVVATPALVIAIAVVITLIIEIDRPWQRLFTVSQQALGDVRQMMTSE